MRILRFVSIQIAPDIPSAPPKDVFLLKYERNKRFVDRPNVFKALDDAIIDASKDTDHCKSVTLCGLGGMGKSEIAREFCYRHKDNYRYVMVVSDICNEN